MPPEPPEGSHPAVMALNTPYYHNPRSELLAFLAQALGTIGPRVLNIGCAAGADAAGLRALGAQVLHGVEPVAPAAAEARSHYDRVDACTFADWEPPMRYDTVILADSLEHMPSPAPVLATVRDLLDGQRPILVLSLPNVRHVSVLLSLILRGDWHYRSAGILDDTHLRFFTARSVRRLLAGCGFAPVASRRYGAMRVTRLLERALPGSGEFLLSQLFILAQPLPLFPPSAL